MGHERVAGGPVDHVGEEHRERPLPVLRREMAEGRGIVRLHQPALRRGQPFQHRAERPPAPRRRDVALHLVGEDHEPDVVVVLRRPHAPAAAPPSIDRFEPRHALDLGGEQPPGIDHDQHLLPPLVLVLPRDRLAPARGGLPVDDAGVVARHPLPEAFEEPALARPPDIAEPGLAPPG